MFGIGGTELFLILLFAFLIFGPDKLPAMGRTIGRAIRQFRNAQDEMNKVIKTEVYDPMSDTVPLKNPFDSKGAKKKSNATAKSDTEETFAERKARMTREKEAARAAKEQSENAAGAKKTTPAAGASTAAAAVESAKKAAASSVKPSAAKAPAAKPETPKERAAALYNVKPASVASGPTSASGEEGGANA